MTCSEVDWQSLNLPSTSILFTCQLSTSRQVVSKMDDSDLEHAQVSGEKQLMRTFPYHINRLTPD